METLEGLIRKHIFESKVLFPKKSGAELEKVLWEVEEVYGTENRKNVDPNRAIRGGKLFHMTYHTVPERFYYLRWGLILSLAAIWIMMYPLQVKARCVVIALLYSGMETSFTYFERNLPYTSLAQFLGNLLYVPVLLDVYGELFGSDWFLYTLFFPLNIYLLEIVEGHLFMLVHGFNVAWCYKDYADEAFNGCIRLGHAVWWFCLGAFCFYFYPHLKEAIIL